MTPRERIAAALAHREPDRVPVDLGATESSGIMAVAYNRLKPGWSSPSGASDGLRGRVPWRVLA